MKNSLRISPIFKASTDNKAKTAQIVQPKARTSLVFLHQPVSAPSPIKISSNPEIIHPIFTSQRLDKITQGETAKSTRIRSSLSDPNFRPLDSLSPSKPKKSHCSKRHRNSCSADISWSPNLGEKEDEIRHKRFDSFEEEMQINDNHLIFEQINYIPNDNQASPLLNINVGA